MLVERGVLTPDQLSRVIAERFGVDQIDLGVFSVDMAAANLLPSSSAKRYGAVPVKIIDDRTLLVAMIDPGNVLAVDDISLMSGYEVRPAVAPEQDIAALIQRLNTLDEVVVAEAIDEDDRAPRSSTCASRPPTRRSSSSCTRSSARASSRAPPTSTSSPSRATSPCATASTAC